MPSNLRPVVIRDEVIELGRLLKLARVVSSGGQAKGLLAAEKVKVNGELETRRGRKLQSGDRIDVDGVGRFIVQGRKQK